MNTFEILQGDMTLESFEPRYNISPSVRNTLVTSNEDGGLTRIPIIRPGLGHRRMLKSAIWPLIPIWAPAQVPKYSTANARSETMTSKASYHHAWKKSQRCLIPATGFYEWQNMTHHRYKQPWHIRHGNREVLSFAGLWERGQTLDGQEFESCSIVTTQANDLMAEIHNSNYRMPVIVDPECWDQWLSCDNEAALRLAVTYPDGQLTADPISTRINNPNYNRSDCLEPVELPA